MTLSTVGWAKKCTDTKLSVSTILLSVTVSFVTLKEMEGIGGGHIRGEIDSRPFGALRGRVIMS
jgi:hypothetical protein